MSDNKKSKFFSLGKGYYIALALCAAVIGAAAFVYARGQAQAAASLQTAPTAGTVSAGEQGKNPDLPVIGTQPTQGQDTDEVVQMPETLGSVVWPVSGETVHGYAMEALSYNQTTRDWRVHNGMDIAAEAGTEVASAADGQVVSVREDDLLGTTVEIKHLGGYTTCYASLSKEVRVAPGDTVKAGQIIGTVDRTAVTETALGPHVHFSVTCQGKPMDPEEFLKLGE